MFLAPTHPRCKSRNAGDSDPAAALLLPIFCPWETHRSRPSVCNHQDFLASLGQLVAATSIAVAPIAEPMLLHPACLLGRTVFRWQLRQPPKKHLRRSLAQARTPAALYRLP